MLFRSSSFLQTAAIFLVTATVYVASPVHVQSDSIWSIPAAISLLRQGNADLDEYRSAAERQPHGIERVGPHLYNWYPLAPSLVALPVVALIEAGVHVGLAVLPTPPPTLLTWEAHYHSEGLVEFGYYARTEGFVASLCTALSVALFWAAARRRLDLGPALFVTAVLAFGTGLWSTTSRVLWQHGPSVAVLSLVVWLLTQPGASPRWALQLGLTAGLAYVCRPTNALTALGLMVFLALRRAGNLPRFLVGAGAIAVPFCAFNLAARGALLPSYFRPAVLGGDHGRFLQALAGNLVSPARGLLVWAPVLAVGLGSALVRLSRRTLPAPEAWMLAVVGVHWVVVSLLPQWWAGHSIGPRFFSDLSPYLCWLLVHPVEWAWGAWRSRVRLPLAGLTLLALAGVFAHGRGATRIAVHRWNDGPPNVDLAPARVWDWGDVQFLRGLAGSGTRDGATPPQP